MEPSTTTARTPTLPESLQWAQRFLPAHFSDPPADFHAELMHDLESPWRRLIARVAPRGHAKSTCAALAYPLWCICEQKRRNIVIITHESSLSLQFVRDIRTELELNDAIREEYGDLCADGDPPPRPRRTKTTRTAGRSSEKPSAARTARRKWTEAKFLTSTGISVQAKGTGASLRGTKVGPQRPDLIICDDLEKDEHVAAPEQRRKLERWLRRVVLPALAPDGQVLVLGSLLHYDALLANLHDKTRFPNWDYRVYRALEAVPDADGNFQRVPLWPARWPLERLDEERQRIGTRAFEQEYQANPVDDSVRVFQPEWLRAYDPSDLVPQRLVPLMAVDPATGVSGGDYFALWIGSLDTAFGTIYTRRLTLERIGVVEQVKRIVAAFDEWKPVKIGIETVAYQVALKEILEEESRRLGRYMPIVAIQTVTNKRARIEGSAPFYENGTFRLPPALDPEIERQFIHFPKARHDDAPDVCAMGIELARSLRTGHRLDGVCGRPNPFARRGGW